MQNIHNSQSTAVIAVVLNFESLWNQKHTHPAPVKLKKKTVSNTQFVNNATRNNIAFWQKNPW